MDMCDIDDNGYRHLSTRRVKARKEHECNRCPKPIVKGQYYIKHVFVDYEGLGVEKYHGVECQYNW